jgi:membrane protein DedA with SNARE-associated domain
VEALVVRYGVIAIFLGSGIEGEPFAIAGGILAHRHWLPLWLAALAAIGGSFLIDQGWFHLSRRFRSNRRVEAITARPAFARSLKMLHAHPNGFVLLFRFAYGLRMVAPVAIGLSSITRRRFVSLNIIAAIVWGAAFTALGFVLGPAFEAAEARWGPAIEIAAVAASALAVAVVLRKGRRR